MLGCQLLLAQPSYTCQYWFDGNYNSHFDTTVTTGHWQTLIETGHLPFGLHTLYMHLQDTSGRWTAPRSFLFLRTEDTLSSHAPSYTCWFDQDRNGTLQQGIIGNGTLLIDVATIDNGLHTFNLQLGDGLAARLQSFLFYKVPMADSSGLNMTYSCWFDQNTSTMQSGNVASGHLLIDATGISIGLHTFNLQLNAGGLTQLQSYMFYRMPIQDTGTAQMVYRCWFDQDYTTLQQGNIAGGHLLIETASLSDGLHTLNLELGSGSMARLSSHLFMKMASIGNATDTTPLLWHYSIDGRDYPPISVSRNGGLIHLDVDVSTIPEGLHTLSHFMTTQQGTTFGVNSSLFYKIPVGGNGVKRYEYWFNDDYANRVTAVLDTVADPFRLVRLLDVDTLSFRSTSFQFDPNGGNPRCYAKNQVTFRFIDAMYRYVSQTAEFVDQRVMRLVTADTLERDTTKVIAAPQGNNIHWFKLYAGVGDSLSFHTDRRCTMQLFAPSGEEVLSTSGSNVLTWTGCHAWEDGVYYLAVHDAEGTGSLSVSYQWIYRYAVLAWDVHRVGNGGISTITFNGNGFNSLDTVFLVKGTDTLPTLISYRESNTTIQVLFDFEDADTGVYNALFVFTDENMIKNSVVFVELHQNIVLSTSVSYPSTFLRGSTVTYTYTITNTGNTTAYSVPMRLYIKTNSFNAISHLSINGLKLKKIYEYIAGYDTLNLQEKQILLDYSNLIGELHYFVPCIDTTTNDNNAILLGYFFTDIQPYETKTVELNIISNESIDTWLSLPVDWVTLTDSTNNGIHISPLSSYESGKNITHPCCWHDTFEEWMTRLSQISGATGLAALLIPDATISKAVALGAGITSVSSSVLSFISSLIAGNVCRGRYGNEILIDSRSGALSLTGITLGIINAIPNMKLPITIASGIGSILTGYPSRASNEANRRSVHSSPDCSPHPPIGGHSSPYVPVDPNEITGYTAKSGNYAIEANQIQLPYTIEFENDSALATGMAHTVVVRDTLDGSVFDLNSFSATSFIINDDVTTINGGQNFIRTIDMRPTIDALAQVQLDYHIDTSFAVATWTFTSLDPMTLLPAADSLGFLGIGSTGEVNFSIDRKADLPDSTLIDNRAWITFDNEEPIATSTWRNIIDNTPPVSSIDSIAYSGSTATVTINATDNLSGVWKYNVYAQMDGDVLLPMAMNVPADSAAVFTTPDEVVKFRSTAIDSAGNVEPLVRTPLITTVYDTTTITACNNFIWKDSTYTISGEYTQRKTALVRNAPDTLSTLLLTINRSTASMESATACDSYTWHGHTYTTSTLTPQFTTLNSVGCDSTVTLHLTINHSSSSDTTATACDSFTWWNTNYTNSTNGATHVLTNAAGCDSTVTLHLTINRSTTGIESVTACDSYTWHGNTYTTSTNTPTYSTNNAVGCDSTVNLHLTVNHSSSGDTSATACDSYTWHGTAYTASTSTPTYLTANSAGCDSTVTLHLTINHSITGTETITACDSYTWHGTAYTASTNTPTYLTTNVAGCDSTVTLHLTINYSNTGTETITACDSYTWHGTSYTASTNTPTYLTTNAAGCDSTITLHLTINYSTTAIETVTACDSYTWHDSIYTTSTLNSQFSTLNSVGCDSTVTLNLTINYSTTGTETITACDAYTWHDSTYTASTFNSQFSTLNSEGCDSTVTLHLTINYSTSAIEDVSACDSYTWHDSIYSTSTIDSITLTNAAGCDSTVTLYLTINYSSHTTIVDTATNSYEWNDEVLTESGEYVYEGQTEAGCDSIVTLKLTIHHVGIADVVNPEGLSIYPNPTSGKLTIVAEGVTKVEVFDQNGRIADTFLDANEVDISHLPTGAYTLRITLHNGTAVKRVIKQ